ncbi:MAG: glycoside hydrolase family 9 protein [Oscillospiraceae bacterium]|nr:glycoside hydrolase family 9 protein [Oscillospiraceae bacterium]
MKKRIQINRLGYMTGMPKSAVCKVTAGIFYLVDAVKGISVYAGRLSRPFFDRESGETVRLADFSDFNVKGRYFIRAGYRRSDVFEISESPYKELRRTVLTGIYLNRCGFDFYSDLVIGRPKDGYMRSECHTEPLSPKEGGKPLNVSGGWHNRGCYCKVTSETCLTAADMLYSIKLFSESFSEDEKALVIDECRWGLDWLLKMQDNDGSVFSGCTYEHGSDVFSPDNDSGEYYLDWKNCISALRFTAVTALAADFFKNTDRVYSEKLRKAAETCWLWVVQSSEYNYYISTKGSVSRDGDGTYLLESEFMWAMCEMYSLTGNESFDEMIEKKYITSSFSGFGSSSCGGFAALSYLLCNRKRNRSVEAFIRKRIIDKADRMWIAVMESGYRTARGADNGFMYASNFSILADCMSFITAYLISGDQKYLAGATDQFSYVFGRNPLGMMFVTGSGEDCCHSPSHKLSGSLDHDNPVPGMVVSGANEERSDDYSKWHIERGSPPALCYIDNEYSYSTNEPAVHFSAPVIFISAFYDKVGRSALSGLHRSKDGI